MQKTKIDWADMTWNPVTGCLHGCEYCYARDIARRFGGHWSDEKLRSYGGNGKIHEINNPMVQHTSGKNRCKPVHDVVASYPYVFDPTFHKYRLDEPAKIKKQQNIFVCSMADLFGEWVPDEWINAIFEACEKSPQHRYLFLTKSPQRLIKLNRNNGLPLTKNFWFGTTVTGDGYFFAGNRNTFLSVEPIMGEFGNCENIITSLIQWVIIGAETGNRKGKVIPERKWIENIVDCCCENKVPVFMKNSLRDIWKEPLIQEYPW